MINIVQFSSVELSSVGEQRGLRLIRAQNPGGVSLERPTIPRIYIVNFK